MVGGGVAGFCAAVAAGRCGKSVALIEMMGLIGAPNNPMVGMTVAIEEASK